MKILLVEDEIELQKSIKQYFELEGNVVETATDFVKAEGKIAIYDYDVILIDITLPKGSGLDLIAAIKQKKSKAGIIIISAKNSLDDKVIIPKWLRLAVASISLFMIFLVPVSRIFLGVHWFTDVLGGFLLGLICLYVMGYFYLMTSPTRKV